MEHESQTYSRLAYSIKEAAHATSLSRGTLYAHIKSGRLKANRIGGRTLITAESLYALVNGEG